MDLTFSNRAQAGYLLGKAILEHGLGKHPIVLALPRGGVPVGCEVAKIVGAPIDVLVVRKLGAPSNPELAFGSVSTGGLRFLDEETIRKIEVSTSEVEFISSREAQEVLRREMLYRRGLPDLDLAGRSAVLVDDGLATGSTMLLAVQCARGLGASCITVATPVASRQAGQRVLRFADDYVCLATPEPLNAVGEWYQDFRQVNDDQVWAMLSAMRVAQ